MADSAFKKEAEEISKVLWMIGWSPPLGLGAPFVVLLAIGYGLDMLGSFLLLGMVASPIVFYAGTRYVNEHAPRLRDAYIGDVKGETKGLMGMEGDVNTDTLEKSHGRSPLIKVDRHHEPITLIVGPASVAIHDDTNLDLAQLQAHAGSNTREFYYDQIGSVTYDEPQLVLKESSGETIQYTTDRQPDSVIHELQDRLRQHKRVD